MYGLLADVGVHSHGRGVDEHVYRADYLVHQPEAHLGVGDLFGDLKAQKSCLAHVLKPYRELELKPAWFKSTLSFIANHCHIAEENQKKRKIVQALPALLFLFSKHLSATGSDNIAIAAIRKKMLVLNNTDASDTDKLLQILEGIGLLKVEGETVRVSSLQIVPMLYEALRHRAINKQVSPDILSITDQLVLTAFVKAVRENGIPLKNGHATVATELLKQQAKKTMFGSALTLRTLAPLLQGGILQSTPAFDEGSALESIESISGDFDRILDLLELNRIFPLLDKNLV